MTKTSPSKDSPILIVGAGAFGLATAHSLVLAGYTNVTVLERDCQVPSRFSGGFDLNKMVRAEYADPFYTPIALKAIRKWQSDPLYQPHFRQVGLLNVVSETASSIVKSALNKYRLSMSQYSEFEGMVIPCPNADVVRSLVPNYTGALPGWNGYLNRLAGYVHSSNAMQAVYEDCLRAGITFKLGAEAVELAYAPNTLACIGVKTRNNNVVHYAETTILALGGGVAKLLPSIGHQVTGRCWGIAHIQLDPDEASRLRGIPATNVRDVGFFFEPDLATNKLKVCHLGGGYTNYSPGAKGLSLPLPRLEDSSFIPHEDEQQMRRLLRDALPELCNRPFIDAHLCWFADTDDSDYIIDFVPDTGTSLMVLSGDSGHGFKMLPIFGDLSRKLLEDGYQQVAKWQWKAAKRADQQKQVDWRASASQDLATARAKL